MAEYRIIAKVDPQTGPGTQKVKQDLRGIQTEAKATETALNRSFDQAKFDKTIGGLVSRLDQLDNRLSGTAASSGRAGKAFDGTTASLDRMSAAEFRAAGGLEGLTKAQQSNTMSASQMEAALRRVLAAVDSNAAEQLRANAMLADAKRLYDQGRISIEQYTTAQRLAAQASAETVVQTGNQRIGMQQLGFQLGDVVTMYSLGAKPAQIFASQIGQITQAFMLMSNGASGVGKFLSGPWGIALTLAVIALAPFVGKLFESNSALDEAIKKKREDARESGITRQAHQLWIGTLDALIERQGRLADVMRERLQVQGLTDQSDLQQAQRDQRTLGEQVAQEEARLARLRQELARASLPVAQTGRGGEAAMGQQALELSRIRDQIKASEGEVARLKQSVTDATSRIVAGQIIVGEQQGKAMVDLATKATQWGDRYQGALRGIFLRNEDVRAQAPQVSAGFEAIRAAIDKAAGAGLNFDRTANQALELGRNLDAGKISASAYRVEMAKLAATLTAAAEAAEKAGRKTSDGVARFTSQRQAIGIAGRELQAAGLDVSGNSQFRYTSGHANDAEHNRTSIDVNASASPGRSTGGITEANVPDLKAKFDAMARRYQARGYKVLWAGQVYLPGGSGPSGPITGADKHYDHMHLSAPATIVGKDTGSSTEAQVRRDEGADSRVAERAEDFVAGVVTKAASRGIPQNAQAELNAAIAETLAEFETRFNRAANAGEKATITKAFTDADTRETARRFDEAYVEPLKRLQELQGKTGVERAILNAVLDETRRKGEALTPVEREMIENGIRGNDQLSREAQLLEQIRGPMEEYARMMEALNSLRSKGEISQASYNARLAEMSAQAANTSFAGLEGVDPATGKNYEDLSAIADEQARYAAQLANFETYRAQLLQMGIDWDALELAAKQQHTANLAGIDQARRDMQLGYAQQIAGSMTSILSDAFGKQSKIARAAFAAEKAVTIARASLALYQNVAEAMKVGFPQNIPLIAAAFAQGAVIIGAVRSVAAPGGYKDGGWTGDGSVNREAGPAHGQEFVVKAPHARENRSLLEAINSGRQVRQVADGRAREAAVASGQQSGPVVVPAPAVNLRMINVTDKRMVQDFFETPEGEQVFVNLVNQNADTISRAASQSGA
jgi:hypothetical protein